MIKGGTDYICYQSILRKNLKKKKIPNCTSRVKIDNCGLCTRKRIPHSTHMNHEMLYKDMKSKNKIIDDVVSLSKQLENLSTEVPAPDIFTRELAT